MNRVQRKLASEFVPFDFQATLDHLMSDEHFKQTAEPIYATDFI